MIQLGLSRIFQLLDPKAIKWKAVHVAGTNGKGSVCAYTAKMLASQGLKVGRFTSPHLIDRWDCIEIDGKAIEQQVFERVQAVVHSKDRSQGIKASEFELLTATAFEAFNRERVDVGVVEVGMGGRTDATNILPPESVLASVITKIGLDHEHFLGDSIFKVAGQKAGIMKPGVICYYDSSNQKDAILAFQDELRAINSGNGDTQLLIARRAQDIKAVIGDEKLSDTVFIQGRPTETQLIAMSLAIAATQRCLTLLNRDDQTSRSSPTDIELLGTVRSHQWPGRLQTISIESVAGRKEPVLLDGAHNPDSTDVLAAFVNSRLRRSSAGAEVPVTWVYASSVGKDVEEMSRRLFKAGDTVITTEFGPVDGMPWVKAEPSRTLLERIKKTTRLGGSSSATESVQSAVEVASTSSNGGPLVIAGSLYLVSDVLRQLRTKEAS